MMTQFKSKKRVKVTLVSNKILYFIVLVWSNLLNIYIFDSREEIKRKREREREKRSGGNLSIKKKKEATLCCL